MIELQRLRYFIAVAEEEHVTRAAERLGIQQPPLTRQIQQLEAALGTPLFERLPRGVRLTDAGRALLGEARAIVARAEGLAGVAQRAARGEEGALTVGYTSSGALHPVVSRDIRAFGRAWPGVAISLIEEGTPELVRALTEERLDAAYVRATTSDTSALLVEPLLEEAMVAALPAEHPLARGGTIALSDLAAETFVLYRRPAGPGLYDAIIAACRVAGFSPTVGQEAPRILSTLSLVAAGVGVSIVPESLRRMNVEGVAYVDLAPGLTAPLLLATRRTGRSAATERFRGAVLAARAL